MWKCFPVSKTLSPRKIDFSTQNFAKVRGEIDELIHKKNILQKVPEKVENRQNLGWGRGDLN